MTFSTTRRVEFRDTDAAGIVHFSAFFPMMEAAEHELLRSLGLSVMPRSNQTTDSCDIESSERNVTWPRVSASCQYLAAAHFEEMLEIEVKVARIGTTSVSYEFTFLRASQVLAQGKMTSVCCRLHRGMPHESSGYQGDHAVKADCEEGSKGSGSEVRLEKTPVPEEIRKLLQRYE